jgi:hypothetical protein
MGWPGEPVGANGRCRSGPSTGVTDRGRAGGAIGRPPTGRHGLLRDVLLGDPHHQVVAHGDPERAGAAGWQHDHEPAELHPDVLGGAAGVARREGVAGDGRVAADGQRAQPGVDVADVVVVGGGDSLWSLAAPLTACSPTYHWIRSKVIVRRSGSTVLSTTGCRPSGSTAGRLLAVPPAGAGALVVGGRRLHVPAAEPPGGGGDRGGAERERGGGRQELAGVAAAGERRQGAD